ncbi:competence protein ComF [Acinetobacter sp. NCu2D-2]|uniref:ComF family protein n=1 Tax=Acinetobacter sp. NCu2D-2 TaxID=1608473 RepID=UPI0007CDD0D5|nr:phosphoribosyltransferase family protein [Acinetobacter sp. NCu2D-2]ANF82599.1 competence protein ComF [Acinetobacter sp. NCu2D-2]
MPMFNLLQTAQTWLRHLQPCQLCHADYQTHYALCQDCWNSLPWSRTVIQRQALDIHIACDYAYPMDRLIQLFKYEQKLHLQSILAGSLLSLRLPKVSAIVPMPISTERIIERGYNQSLVLAKHIAKHLNVPVWQPITRRAQHSQKGLSRLERIEDIDSQFEINNPSKLCYRRVLIIDDVVTTGSSIRALSDQLKLLGCTHIHAACIAGAKI